jgi:hypothetical protein
MVAVVLKLVVVLRLLEPLSHLEDELIALYQLMVHRQQARLTGCVSAQGWWLATVDHLEWSCAERRAEAGVVAVLCPCQPL